MQRYVFLWLRGSWRDLLSMFASLGRWILLTTKVHKTGFKGHSSIIPWVLFEKRRDKCLSYYKNCYAWWLTILQCYCFCSFTSVCCGVFFKRPYLRSVRFFYPFVRYAFAFYCGHVCLLSLCFLLQKWRPSRSFFLPDISEVIRIYCLSSRIAHKMGWSHPHNYYFRSQLHCQDPTEESLQFFITSLYFWICFT